jgi:hypothetical protein
MLKVTHDPDDPELVVVVRRRSILHRVGAAFGIFIVVVALVVGGLYWRLTRASIGLGFLTSRMEAALEAGLPPGARVKVGSTAIAYRDADGIILRIQDLELSMPGIAAVSAKELTTTSSASVLFGGQISLNSVKASGVAIGVSRPPRLVHDGSTADAIRNASSAFMAQVIKADTIMRDAGLKEVAIKDSSVHLDDSFTGPSLTIADATWSPLGDTRSKAWIQILEKSGHDWDLTIERRKTRTGETTVTVEIEDLPVTSLVPQLAGGDGAPFFHSTVTLQARMAQKEDGSFIGLRGLLSTAEGQVSLNGEEVVNLDATALSFALDATGERMAIPNAEVRAKTGRMQFEGVADLAEKGGVTLLCRVRGGTLPTPIGDEKNVAILGGGGLARIDFATLGIDVQRFDLMTRDGTASAIGQASLAGPTPGLSFALSIGQMPAGVVRALWPPFVAAKVRLWFDRNVTGGTLGPGTLTVALPPDSIGPQNRGKVLPPTALVGTLPFQDGEFTPIPTFPPIKHALGGITFGNATASIWAQSGVMDVGGEGTLQAGGTTLIIPQLGRTQPRGDLHLELAGSAAALAVASDTPPLSIAAKHGIVADGISGDATLSLDANIPIYESDFSDVIPTFRLALSKFTSTHPIDGRMIEEADLVLEGSPKSFTVKGLGKLDGFDASVDLILGTAAPDTSAVTVELDEAARKRLGFAFGSLVTGPVLASLTHSGEPRQQVALDLKQARISLPFLGWEKGAGVPATASFVMEKTSEGTEVTNFLLSGKGFEARGNLSLGPDGRVNTLTLEKLALRSGDQLTVTATANDSGYDVVVKGTNLDARGMLKGVGSGFGGSTADIFPIHVTLNLEVVRGQNDIALSNVAGKMTVTKNGLDQVSLKGFTNSNQPFEWTVGREGNTRVTRVFADGGGALVRFSGVYSRVAGGNLVVDYSGPIGGAGSGVAMLRDFRLINEAALASAVQAAPQPSGPQPPAPHDPSNPSGPSRPAQEMHFSELKIPFTQEGWVININDATLRGGTLGATAGGTINLPDSKMAISGTFIPAFGINNIAGAIPIIGQILGGGRNEGLVGITYKLFGPIDDPKLVMNPISAIAPGIFRKIFEYR